MNLSAALRAAIECIDYRLKKQYTVEANMHDRMGLAEFSKEARARRRLVKAKTRLEEELKNVI